MGCDAKFMNELRAAFAACWFDTDGEVLVAAPVDCRDLRLALSLLLLFEVDVLLDMAELGTVGMPGNFGIPPASAGKLLICFIRSFILGKLRSPPREFKLPN